VTAGSYFIEGVVEAGGTPSLSATVTPGDGLSWSVCSGAPLPVLPDDLSALASLTLFYPSSPTSQFTSLPTPANRTGQLLVTSFNSTASISLCTGCDLQTCATADRIHALPLPVATPSPLVSVPAGDAITASFFWF